MEQGLYGQEELSLVPEIARDLSRGCGNPVGFADIRPGDTVVDLGCGGGIDVILAAQKAGTGGRVVGVDFAPQMIEQAARAVAEAGLSDRVELLVGDMERLELPPGSADVAISNCVINLCPDKDSVYREAFRILRPGGRLAVSDIVTTERMEPRLRERFRSAGAGCLGGAVEESDYLGTVRAVGFDQIEAIARHLLTPGELEALARCPGEDFTLAVAEDDMAVVQGKVASIKFTASKPEPR